MCVWLLYVHELTCFVFFLRPVCVCVCVCTSEGAGVQDAQGDAGIHATIKSAPQEAGRVAEIREGYYQQANSSLSLGPAPRHVPLNTHTHTHTLTHTHTHTQWTGRTKPTVTQHKEAGGDNTSINTLVA